MRGWWLAIAVAGAAALIGLAGSAAEEEPWPPDWYVDPAANRAEHAALRRRAIATPSTEFPPNATTIAYLRNMAVEAATAPGERVDDARVFPGAGYVLQLRGRISTAELAPPHWARGRKVLPPFRPCLTFVLDTATLSSTSMSLGECEDFSFRGDGLELDLRDEGG